jgi:hypothetical protein
MISTQKKRGNRAFSRVLPRANHGPMSSKQVMRVCLARSHVIENRQGRRFRPRLARREPFRPPPGANRAKCRTNPMGASETRRELGVGSWVVGAESGAGRRPRARESRGRCQPTTKLPNPNSQSSVVGAGHFAQQRAYRVDGAREIRGCKSVTGPGRPGLPAEQATRFESSEASHRQHFPIRTRKSRMMGENFRVQNLRPRWKLRRSMPA